MATKNQYREVVPTAPKMPSIATRVANLAEAAPAILASRGARVPDEEFRRRLNLCMNCPERRWDPAAYFGYGGCTHPKCGCSKGKLKFRKSACPIEVWREFVEAT
jgi:hypothetical protein